MENGEHLHGNLVVAADGIRSLTRTVLFGADQPHFEGYVAWRGLVLADNVPERIRVSGASFGNGRFIVSYPIRRRELMNFVAFARSEKWEEEGWRIPSRLSELQQAFGDFHDDVQALIRETPPDRLFKWGIFGRPRLSSWIHGRVVLLGDAAHPMLSYMTQGAAMAIEDALMLARALKLENDPEQGLRRWEAARMPRVSRVSDASAAMAELFHADVDNYDPAKDVSGGRLPDLATYDALSAPI
jgi:salicylate hydroxylase